MYKFKQIFALLICFLLVLLQAGNIYAFSYQNGDPSEPYVAESGLFAPSEGIEYIPITGEWRLKTGKSEDIKVKVPGCWETGQGEVYLSTVFRVPENLGDRHFRLVFWGAGMQLQVKVNGQLVEAWDGDWSAFVIDLPNGLIKTDRPNKLEVEINDKLSARSSIPLKPKTGDPLDYSGIFADVGVLATPPTLLEDAKFSVSLSEENKKADWKLALVFRNYATNSEENPASRKVNVEVSWIDANGNVSKRSQKQEVDLDPVDAAHTEIKGTIDNPLLWSPEFPNRYQFIINVSDETGSYSVSLKTGLINTSWKGENFIVNGEKLSLRGIDLILNNKIHNAALSYDEIRTDLEKIKRAGFNFVRINGGKPHPSVAEVCDQIGLLLVPQLGLGGVPEKIFLSTKLQQRIGNALGQMVLFMGNSPSIIGWGVAEILPGNESVINQLKKIQQEIPDPFKRNVLAGFTCTSTPQLPAGVIGVSLRSPYSIFEKSRFTSNNGDSWIIGSLGTFTSRKSIEADSTEGDVLQADALLHQLNESRTLPATGFLINLYSDVLNAWPLMINGAESDKNLYRRGLLSLDRDERIAWQKTSEALGKARIEPPVMRDHSESFPVVFPVATLVIFAIILISRRQNNVFRQHMNRVFAHTYGFFVDIRDRRYFHMWQTFLIAISVSGTLAIFTASWLYHERMNFALNYLLTLLLPFKSVQLQIVNWAWNPTLGLAGFVLLYLGIIILISLILHLFSLPSTGSLGFRQSLNLVAWGASHFLILLPLGLVHFRLLGFGWYLILFEILVIIFVLWYFLRLIAMVRVGYRISFRMALIANIVFFVSICAVIVTIFNGSFAIFDYFDYFSKVILPWTTI